MGDVVQNPWDQAPADDQHQSKEGSNLGQGDAESSPDRTRLQPRDQPALVRLIQWAPAHQPSEGRDKNKDQNHGEVFDNEPAHHNAPTLGFNEPPVLQGSQHDYGARDRERQSEDNTRAPRPSEDLGQAETKECHKGNLPDSTRYSDGADSQEVLQGNMQSDAEHEQDHANFGELRRQGLISHKARRGGPDQDTCQEIADKRREPEAVGEHAANECEPKTGNEGRDEARMMGHWTFGCDSRTRKGSRARERGAGIR